MNTMARSWLLVVSLGVALALVSVTTRAATDPNGDANAPAQSAESGAANDRGLPQISGTIRAVDLTAGTITVKGLFLSKTISVRPEAQIGMEGKATAALSDLKVGDRVLVTYHRDGQMFVADKVTLPETKDQNSGSSPQNSGSSPSSSPSSSGPAQ